MLLCQCCSAVRAADSFNGDIGVAKGAFFCCRRGWFSRLLRGLYPRYRFDDEEENDESYSEKSDYSIYEESIVECDCPDRLSL